MDQNDIKNLPRNDQAVLGLGVLVFILSFFPYYGVSGSAFGQHVSESTTAWHGWNVFALLLLLVATLIAAAQTFAAESVPEVPVSLNLIVAALCGLGTLILIIRSFTLEHGSVGPVDYGLRWGAYLLMIAAVAQAVFAFMRLRASGDAMPWDSRSPAAPPEA